MINRDYFSTFPLQIVMAEQDLGNWSSDKSSPSPQVAGFSEKSTFPVSCIKPGLVAWGWCTGMTQRDGTGREEGGGSGWGTCVHLWWIQVDVWQNQYNIVK